MPNILILIIILPASKIHIFGDVLTPVVFPCCVLSLIIIAVSILIVTQNRAYKNLFFPTLSFFFYEVLLFMYFLTPFGVRWSLLLLFIPLK